MALVNGTSHQGRNFHLASNRTLAQPLPRLTPTPDLSPASSTDGLERHEVVICGAGPAGLFMNLLLARYGLPSSSRLCIDENSAATKTGHADGLFPRTLEVLKSLDLADEILNNAAHVRERGVWAYNEEKGGIERQGAIQSLRLGDHRFGDGFECIHQGRVERILEDDLGLYCETGVVRETRCVGVKIDEASDVEFPIAAILESDGIQRTVRTKYLIGADGGRSTVRRSLGIQMEGQTLDDVWGVVDLVANSDFPDLRRTASIIANEGTVLLVPREKKSNDDIITRVYLPFPHPASGNGETKEHHEAAQRAHRSTITLDRILAKAAETFKPYRFRPKQGTEVEWWAGYQVGQRVASRFAVADSKQHPRIFLMGDACHTHSPSLGQGMNVSMMDAFDISWKMVHTLFGLTPDRTGLLETYEVERREHALNLIDVDKRWYHTRYGKLQQDRGASVGEGQVWQEIMKFISGTGIEYQAGSMLVDDRVTPEDVESIERYSAGALREGRRLEDVVVTRLADGCLLHLHDEIRSDGKYSIVIWTGRDLLKKESTSQKILRRLCEGLLPSVARNTIKVFVLHSLEHLSFEWTDLPSTVRTTSETRVYKLDEPGYEMFGIDVQKGAMCVVRPDMYIGSIAELTEGAGGFQKVAAYLERCVVPDQEG